MEYALWTWYVLVSIGTCQCVFGMCQHVCWYVSVCLLVLSEVCLSFPSLCFQHWLDPAKAVIKQAKGK
jgi:hypothetical protein